MVAKVCPEFEAAVLVIRAGDVQADDSVVQGLIQTRVHVELDGAHPELVVVSGVEYVNLVLLAGGEKCRVPRVAADVIG